MAADAGKIPTWVMVLGTGIAVVLYAQREFTPRAEQNLIAERRNEQLAALIKRDEELARSIKELALRIEEIHRISLAAVDDHARRPSHIGTTEQNAAIQGYLITHNANIRQIYSTIQAIAAKQNVAVPPLVEAPLPPTPTYPR